MLNLLDFPLPEPPLPMVADLSVIMVNWRNEAETLRCIACVKGWRSLKPTLFMVDNESTEASRSSLGRAITKDELISSKSNLGYAGGNNLGIKRALSAGASFVLLLNSDAAISESDVNRLLDRLRTNPDIGIVGPVLREVHQASEVSHVGGRDIVRNALTRQSASLELLSRMPGYPLIDVDYVPGTVFLARKSIFEQIGLLHEQYFFSGEIADFCKRARDAGYRVCIDAEIEARHEAGATPQALRDTLYVYYSLRNRLLYAKRHHPFERSRNFALWSKLCLAELVRALARGNLRKARAIVLAMAHGCTNRFGNQNAAFL